MIIISLALSLIFNLVGMYINYKTFKETDRLKWSYKMPGGECMVEIGFGLLAVHKYAMRQDGQNSHRVRFAPITFFLQLLILGIVIYLITLLLSIP